VDLFLGIAFNWAGAVALQTMIAQQCDLELGEFIWVGGDIHLYLNHLDQARLQLTRGPRPFPKLILKRRAASIDDYRIDDFDIEGYDPHPHIAADVAV
jgi:thymidylate synthase